MSMDFINFVDIAIIVIIAIFAAVGFGRGFLRSLFSMLAAIVGLAVAIFGCGAVVGMLDTVPSVYNAIQDGLYSSLTESADEGDALVADADGNYATAYLKELGVQETYDDEGNLTGILANENLLNSVEKLLFVEGGAKTSVEYFHSALVTNLIFYIGAFVALYLVVTIIFLILFGIVALFCQNKVLSLINRICGAVWGIFKGTLLVMFILFFIAKIAPAVPNGTDANGETNEDYAYYTNYYEKYLDFSTYGKSLNQVNVFDTLYDKVIDVNKWADFLKTKLDEAFDGSDIWEMLTSSEE